MELELLLLLGQVCFISYTAHYITDDWNLESKVLSTHCSEERHTAENLAKDIAQTEKAWGIDKLLFQPVYVHDNASNATKAPKVMDNPRLGIGCLGSFHQLSCMFSYFH